MIAKNVNLNIGDLVEVEGPDGEIFQTVFVKDDPEHGGWIFKNPKEKDLSKNCMIIRYRQFSKVLKLVKPRAYVVTPIKTPEYWKFQLDFI